MVVVIAGADEAATLQFLAPYTGATIAEYFMLFESLPDSKVSLIYGQMMCKQVAKYLPFLDGWDGRQVL